MRAAEVWPGLGARSTVLLCSNNSDRDDRGVYRVPVEHRALAAWFPDGRAVLDGVPDGVAEDLKAVLRETGGVGLFAARAWKMPRADGTGAFEPSSTREQAAVGSIIVWPPSEWERLRSEFSDWHYDGGVEAQFAEMKVPYAFEDIVIFASINFSPDCWFVVTRGAMAGKVFWWTHDGDSEMHEPWAESIAAWGRRVWSEAPEVFGGVIRFDGSAAEGEVPEGAELYPERVEVG